MYLCQHGVTLKYVSPIEIVIIGVAQFKHMLNIGTVPLHPGRFSTWFCSHITIVVSQTCGLNIGGVFEMEISTVSDIYAWYHGDTRHDPGGSDSCERPSRSAEVDTLHRLTHCHISLVCKQGNCEFGHDMWQKDHPNGYTTSIRTVDAENDITVVTSLPG